MVVDPDVQTLDLWWEGRSWCQSRAERDKERDGEREREKERERERERERDGEISWRGIHGVNTGQRGKER